MIKLATMEALDSIHTSTSPNTFDDDTDDSALTSPWDPLMNNLDIIILTGYSDLNSTERWTWLLIANHTREGEELLTEEKLTEIQPHGPRTTYNALVSLKAAELITIDEDGHITPLQPNPRDPDFRSYITEHCR